MKRALLVVASLTVLAAAALVAVRLGGGREADAASTASAADAQAPTTSAPPSGPPAVLTGLPISDVDDLDRPALIVKVDNAPAARPQAGLERADVVYEEVVEGGVVRFMAVFQSQDAELVGPVRSLRPVDGDIVWPLKGLFAYSGGTAAIERAVKKAPVRMLGYKQNEGLYSRRTDKRAPHNVYVDTADFYKKAKDDDGRPPALFRFAGSGAGTSGRAAAHATVVMGGRTTAAWDWDPAQRRWLRTTNGTAHTVEGGTQLAFSNVVVQYVRYRDTAARDQAGFAVPTAEVVGSGDALVLAGGTMVRAKWSKPKPADVTVFTDATGVPVQLQPGPTWVMLAPLGAPTTTR